MNNTISANNEKLVKEFKSVIADAESLLAAASNQTGDSFDKLRHSMKTNIANAKDRLITLEEELLSRAKDAVKAGDEFVHENPYPSLLVAGGVGLLAGFLLSSCRK